MSQGTLYLKDFPRAILPRALVNHYKINVDVVADASEDAVFKKDFPMGRVPTFVGPNDYILHEVIAVNPFLVHLTKDEKVIKTLLGADYKEECQVLKWISLCNSDFFMTVADIFYEYIDRFPYHQDIVDRGLVQIDQITEMFEAGLKKSKYLVNDHITLADLFCITEWAFCLQHCFGPEWREKHPLIVNWVLDVIKSPIIKDEYKDFTLAEKTFEPTKK
ncbi:hypothetical protein Kpol_331p1 [Vanderwaltozyma polyspora DSM 70294]|uniref:GST C-terminal domain-containing protein n=1 Tax=Vanderwaltozyma polyspora (strain ATCC 22028 / DSM 70294 / BCRC 21397 / CBS 2163 / NBRC 10782 / NRRL Y-8283 / UCD 57-17) TaxID=436907 RepID=A7TT13_VANPO|nr:uncharacterized protein Kpol_331p1 [Vanderwaltozyma polyspora DSM 70294]EDO14592.1 hypothetical protein Kpol_331p1 [Vanderwaltozyma polyspora DSM 70294]